MTKKITQNLLLPGFFALMVAWPASAQTTVLLARTSVFLDDNGAPSSGDSTIFSYNNLHQPILYKSWKIIDSTWELKTRVKDIVYNPQGKVLYQLGQVGNDLMGWTDAERKAYTYDADGRELSQHFEKRDGTSWITQWLSTTEWVLNANGQVLSKTRNASSRTLYTYNALDSLETEVNQKFNDGNWVNKERYDYAYTIADVKLMSVTTSIWDGVDWALSTRKSFTYDAVGDMTQHLVEAWGGNDWLNLSLYTYSYDANHNPILWRWQTWNAGVWEYSFQQHNAYDDESHWLNSRFEQWAGTSWQLISYGNNYYSELVSAKVPVGADFQVFPNPASTSVLLRGEGLSLAQIIDVQGHLVLSELLAGQSEATLATGSLPAGAYFLKVLDKDGQVGVKPLQIRH